NSLRKSLGIRCSNVVPGTRVLPALSGLLARLGSRRALLGASGALPPHLDRTHDRRYLNEPVAGSVLGITFIFPWTIHIIGVLRLVVVVLDNHALGNVWVSALGELREESRGTVVHDGSLGFFVVGVGCL